jgi:hypothetical protein
MADDKPRRPPPPPLPKGDRSQNPQEIGFFALLREDLRTHDGDLFEQGFWASGRAASRCPTRRRSDAACGSGTTAP